jgi:hypothetical protein
MQMDKQQEIGALNSQLGAFKDADKNFVSFFESEKFNFMKRSLLLVELGTALSKL